LPEETAVKILSDELLLSRLERANDTEEFIELVDNEVIGPYAIKRGERLLMRAVGASCQSTPPQNSSSRSR
ncbi:MAG TPA: hypothetical protein VMM13_06865, partial [Euzebya sp.]|nr:hypothetical protein [Euzebya sp.]